MLTAWLYTATPDADWEKLRPVLDEVVDQLSEVDRTAVLLRFFENRPFASIGVALNLTEDAARMRVDRALQKLHALLARRGVTSTAAALAAVLSHQAIAMAPANLAAAVTAGAVTSGAAVTGGVMAFMRTTKIVMGVAALVAALGIGGAIFEMRVVAHDEAELATLRQERDAATAKAAELGARWRVAELSNAAATAQIRVRDNGVAVAKKDGPGAGTPAATAGRGSGRAPWSNPAYGSAAL